MANANPKTVPVPTWLIGVLTTLLTASVIALGGWVLKTWNMPDDVETLQSTLSMTQGEIDNLERELAAQKLADARSIAGATQDIAVMKLT